MRIDSDGPEAKDSPVSEIPCVALSPDIDIRRVETILRQIQVCQSIETKSL
jgi:hypothetical protein